MVPPMTSAELMAATLFILTIIGAVAAFWWRVEGKVKVAEDKVDKVSDALSSHRLHVSETYLTKQGMRESIEPIMDAIHGVKSAVDHMGGRIDGLYHTATPRPRTQK